MGKARYDENMVNQDPTPRIVDTRMADWRKYMGFCPVHGGDLVDGGEALACSEFACEYKKVKRASLRS